MPRDADLYRLTERVGGEGTKVFIQIADPSTTSKVLGATGVCGFHDDDLLPVFPKAATFPLTVDGKEYELPKRFLGSVCPKCFRRRWGVDIEDVKEGPSRRKIVAKKIRANWHTELSEPFERVDEITLEERVAEVEDRLDELEDADGGA